MIDEKTIIGIGISNPVDIVPETIEKMIDEAVVRGIKHVQIHGPVHHRSHANIDGSIFYRKYRRFNAEKDEAYITLLSSELPSILNKAVENNVEVFFWHHEIEIPDGFIEAYPAVLNGDGEIEASSPILEDFIRNKISDFFDTFPGVAGLVITLHETVVPLLKLPNQRLDKRKRIEHICRIILSECGKCGKKAIFRPFASLPEDAKAMTEAFNALGDDLEIMTKWTQFDWHLHLPWNSAMREFSNHPLWIEGDLNGEYFGQGRIPCILGKHVAGRIKSLNAEEYHIKGLVMRTDRNEKSLFGQINEVNIDMVRRLSTNPDIDTNEIVNDYVDREYNGYASVKKLFMESQDIVGKLLYVGKYYFSAGSFLPNMSAVKNHYYCQLINGTPGSKISSEEWYIPPGFRIPEYDLIIAEKLEMLFLVSDLSEGFRKECACSEPLHPEKREIIENAIINLRCTALIWTRLVELLRAYSESLNRYDPTLFRNALADFIEASSSEKWLNGEADYFHQPDKVHSPVSPEIFAAQIRENFVTEMNLRTEISNDPTLIDYIIPGSFMEGHALRKEVNFSDNEIIDGCFVRYLGKKGVAEEGVNILIGAYGWCSYEIVNKDLRGDRLEIIFFTNGEPAKVCISFPDSHGDERIFKIESAGKFHTCAFNIPRSLPETFRIEFNKLSRAPLGLSLIKLCGNKELKNG